MRPTSSCTACRNRKKRCTVTQPGSSCTLCTKKGLICDLADGTRSGDSFHALAPRHPSTHALESAPNTPGANPGLPPESVCNELVDLYFDIIDEKQLILFHRDTFIATQRAGQAPEFLVLAMIALVARFSSNSYFANIHPWHRAKVWFRTAMQSFNARSDLINLDSLQGSILLPFVAFTEGDFAQEALLASQAICMVQMMRLPLNLSQDPIQREIEIRAFWETWMMDTWHSARAQIPRQLMTSPSFKQPLDEDMFRNMKATYRPDQYSETRIDALGLRRCGLWSSMLTLTEIHGQVMRLNDEMVQNSVSEVELRGRVREISDQLDSWVRDLPSHLQDSRENRERYASRGLGREFAVQRLVYHHQSQLLYYQFLNRKLELPEGGTDHEAAMYAARCKAHATALSQVMWDTNSSPGMECLWSPVNGHLLVVASSVLLYTDSASISTAKKLLEQNFIMLLQFRKYWPLLELSMTRLRAFHRACQMNSTQENFDMDRWMMYFLNRYDAQVSERYSDGVYGPTLDHSNTNTGPAADLGVNLSQVVGTIPAVDASSIYFH